MEEGEWYWYDGAYMAETPYSQWSAGEPNNHGEGENCGAIMYDGYTWNDMPCEAYGVPICQYYPDPVSEPSEDEGDFWQLYGSACAQFYWNDSNGQLVLNFYPYD